MKKLKISTTLSHVSKKRNQADLATAMKKVLFSGHPRRNLSENDAMEDALFVLDSMLGRLAKWLRILGLNAYYVRNVKDDDLIRISSLPGHILVDQDTGLLQRSWGRCLLFYKERTMFKSRFYR